MLGVCVIFCCDSNLHFPNDQCHWEAFHGLWLLVYHLLWKKLKYFALFSNWLSYYYWDVRVLYVYWMQVHCQTYFFRGHVLFVSYVANLCLPSGRYFLLWSHLGSFWIFVFAFRSRSILKYLFFMERGKGQNSFCSPLTLSSYFRTICWKEYPFLIELPWSLHQK